jgi:hypothetical protein
MGKVSTYYITDDIHEVKHFHDHLQVLTEGNELQHYDKFTSFITKEIVEKPVEIIKLVEKIVPFETVVEKIVERVVDVPYEVVKTIEVPVEKLVERVVQLPPVTVEKEVFVEKVVETPVLPGWAKLAIAGELIIILALLVKVVL